VGNGAVEKEEEGNSAGNVSLRLTPVSGWGSSERRRKRQRREGDGRGGEGQTAALDAPSPSDEAKRSDASAETWSCKNCTVSNPFTTDTCTVCKTLCFAAYRFRMQVKLKSRARREEARRKEQEEEERLQKERLAKERLEKERLEKQRLEKERLEKERLGKPQRRRIPRKQR